MPRLLPVAVCAISSPIAAISSAFAAGSPQHPGALPWFVVPIAAGLVAVAWALIAMHRLRIRLRREQARTAESLRESERRYRAIVEDQSELICRWRPDGTHTYVNPAYCRSFGKTADELLGTKVLDLIPEADHERARQHWDSLTPSRPAATHQHRVIAASGEIRLQEWTDRATFDADGNLVELQSVGRDITDRQRADDRLKESESRFRTLSESAPIGIFRADQNGWTNFVNEHLLRISGLSAEESIGHGWMKIIHPEDFEAVRTAIEAGRRERVAISQEFRIITTWTDVRWVRVNTVWITDVDGVPTEQVGTVEDITDEKRTIELARIQRDLAGALGTTSQMGEALDLVLGALFNVGSFDAGAVHLVDGDSGDVHMLHSKGLSQDYIAEMFHQSAESPIARIIEKGAATSDDAEALVLPRGLRDRERLSSIAIVPIAFKGRTIGVLMLGSRKPTRIPQRDLAVFEMIAAQIGGAISRIRAVNELRAERDHSTRIIQGTPAIVCGVATDGRTLFVNPACERITGYAAGEIVGRNWWTVFYPGEERAEVDRLMEALQKGDVRDFEMRLTTRDGDKRTISWNSINRLDENGDILEIIGFGNDVTARRLAEDELRKFKTIADKMPHGQAIADMSGTLLYVNAAWARMHGYEPEELVDQHLSVFHSKEQMEQVDRLNEALLRDGSYTAQEVWHIRRDGTPFPTLMDATVIKDEAGRPLYLSGTAGDITQRKGIEASLLRQAFVLNSINDAVYLTDAENRITYWNAAAEDVFGYRVEEALGRSPSFIYHPNEIESLDACIRTGLIEDGFWADEVRFCTKDGDEIICETFCAPVCDEKENRIGTVAVHRDITARKQSEEEKARLRAQLNHSQKLEAVGTLACGIAHDFNNLLSAIFGHTHLAKVLLEPGHPALRSLDMVTQTASQARGVVSALLTFSRKSVVIKKEMDVVESVHDAIRLLRRLLPGSIEVTEQLPAAPLWVSGDDAQLKQIWMNLAVNSRDAMPSGGLLAIEVSRLEDTSAIPCDQPNENAAIEAVARIRIKDTGRGMSADVLERVYEPFFTTKPRSEGTGLGMSVVHAIVEDHGGTMQIESTEGVGTSVDVFLPVRETPRIATPPTPEQTQQTWHNEAILLLEDDAHIRSILTSSLRSLGFEVFAAGDPRTSIDVLARHLPDIRLLILNVDIPNLDRLAFLSEVMNYADSLPVIVITADKELQPSADLGERQRILRMPYQIEDLVSVTNEMLDSARPDRSADDRAHNTNPVGR